MDDDQVSDLIGRIYDAALDPAIWPEVFSSLSRLTGESFLVARLHKGGAGGGADGGADGGAHFLHLEKHDPRIIDLFMARYATPDKHPLMAPFLSHPVGSPLYSTQYFNKDEILAFDAFQDIFAPQDLDPEMLGLPILRQDDVIMLLALARTRRQGSFGDADFRLLAQLAPHFGRAAKLWDALTGLRTMRDLYEETMDGLACGIVLLDRDGRARFLNRAARRLVDGGSGLVYRNGRLEASRRGQRAGLQALIAQAAGRGRTRPSGGAISLGRNGAGPPLPCLVVPVSPARASRFAMTPAVLLVVADPDHAGQLSAGMLARLYGLSPRQAVLVSLLLAGRSLPEAAEQMQIKLSTARTHLERVFAKFGAGSQGELIRAIAAGPGAMLSDAD